MALFANSLDLAPRHGTTPKLASCHFVASARSSATLAESGHSALSAPSQIIGRFQMFKTMQHPHLCEYVEIHRGKHDRLFVVSEYFDRSLQKTYPVEEKPSFASYLSDSSQQQDNEKNISMIQQIAWEVSLALKYLRENDVTHACLAPHNILLDTKGHVKLYGYGLYAMTDSGIDVDFPIGYPPYLAPECIIESDYVPSGVDKRDYWALAIILLEQYTQSPFWTTADIGLIFDSLVCLNEWAIELKDEDGTDVWHHADIQSLGINAESLAFLQGHQVPDRLSDFRKFILGCLQVLPQQRWNTIEIVSCNWFKEAPALDMAWVHGPVLVSDAINQENESKSPKPAADILSDLPITQVYHLWKLAGGDVELDYAKRNVSTSVIERLPRVCKLDRTEIGDDSTDTFALYSDNAFVLNFKELYARLEKGAEPQSGQIELDAEYFSMKDDRTISQDINFLLEYEPAAKDGEDDEFVYLDDVPQPRQMSGTDHTPLPTPTTPSISHSMIAPSSVSGMSRSESSSSLSPESPTSLAPSQTPTTRTQLSLREKDVNYQYRRQCMFSALLRQYPASRRELIHHANVDIPPLLRGKVWAAILGVQGDVERAYDRIDKYTDKGAHRQIELDVPRCHQYNQLLASSAGHEKLKRLLKAWVSTNNKLEYWQGLDSLTAPFLTLCFNDEALAFASLQKFIPKFLTNIFLKNNSEVLNEYLAVFRHLQSYHDPELSSHLDLIEFGPDHYAIMWFMTLFTHLFPLDKIYALWDKLVLGPQSFPMFMGVAILQQIRDKILKSEYNDCITLFSDKFPEVDIEKCVQRAMTMCKVTPPSVVARQFGQSPHSEQTSQEPPSINKIKELAPRISAVDMEKILPYALTLDIRPESDFIECHIQSSMNVKVSELESYAAVLQNRSRKLKREYHVVIDSMGEDGPEFATKLVRHRFQRVALLQNEKPMSGLPQCNCRPRKQTTPERKGKGSEPPFVIWLCKIPLPLKKK